MTEAPWHIAIRIYRGSGSPEEIGTRARAGLLPLLRRQRGFQAYLAARIDGGGGVFSVTVFAGREAALAANDKALDWARAEMADLLTGPPEVTLATADLLRRAPQTEGGHYLMLRRHAIGEGPPPSLREALVALTERQPGFRLLYEGQESGRPGHDIAITLFSNRDTATAAHAQAVALMARHREAWPQRAEPPLAGEILLQAMAERQPETAREAAP